ncbi:hypothetical protein F511_06251 [Dorcoceras hygrometricum]|uniref:Uncharacterized protein n=1 Tax=Dorcoceras hygrometricum TaxID=472368 RepID=A0A2Z7B5H3_9LAMI|nr:hypothetical protein F511_06251 [Dorcoceras hygrometricum]
MWGPEPVNKHQLVDVQLRNMNAHPLCHKRVTHPMFGPSNMSYMCETKIGENMCLNA